MRITLERVKSPEITEAGGLLSNPCHRSARFAMLAVAVFAAWGLAKDAGPAAASGAVCPRPDQRLAEFQRVAAQLEQSPLQLPVHIESEQTTSRLQGDVYSIVEHRFDATANALTRPESWCEILPLQLNVKACTYGEVEQADRGRRERANVRRRLLTMYIGRKFYQKPEAAHALALDFEVGHVDEDCVQIALRAEDGPLGTRNYVLAVSAVPLDAGRTFTHLSYSYEYGLMSRMAMFAYLKTLGRKRVGFTVVGTDSKDRPIHVGGMQGVIERNAMRYHLAMQAYLDTLGISEPQRFERRIERWFDLTSRYPEQLFEMEREEYLDNKRRERAEQERLQQAIGTAAHHLVASTPDVKTP